ncbi:MAG: aminotransferase IV, partial [Flavobacteriaceae bacterium]|nr:aminotransferase IV [Flavobacteriaceae bacterium]
LCQDLDIPVIERPIAEDEIQHMEEAFFTGTTTQVAAISQLGDHTFYKNGQAGELTEKLQIAFSQLRNQDTANHTL